MLRLVGIATGQGPIGRLSCIPGLVSPFWIGQLSPVTWKCLCPRATRGFNRDTNEVLLQQVRVLAEAHDATPGQVALAWLLAQHPWIVPIPGTRRAERIAENATATQLALSADDIAVLDSIARRVGVYGNRYNDHHMALVVR